MALQKQTNWLNRRLKRSGLRGLGVLCLLVPALLQAQQWQQQGSLPPHPGQQGSTVADPDGAEFNFARLMYNGGSYSWGGRGAWTTDMPEAEHFFMEGITRLTRVDGRQVSLRNGEGSTFINLKDETVFDYPFLYAVEVGRWSLDQEEVGILREYLQRGGFLMVDDFHGSDQWRGFMSVMQRVFPDRPVVDVPIDDEIFRVFYELDDRMQVPGLAALYEGRTWEYDGFEPHWRGVYDDDGRLMVMINHNMDLGDAWEHADMAGYPEPMTAMAYRFAVNYLIYALTH